MKNLSIVLVALVAMFVVTMSSNEAQAQCFNRGAVVVNSGFNSFVPQQVVVPQSTAFFSGGNVAFINQPRAFVNVGVQRAFVQPVVAQQINVRRGLFGNVRRVQVNNVVGRQAVVVGGHGRNFVNVNVGRSRVFIR